MRSSYGKIEVVAPSSAPMLRDRALAGAGERLRAGPEVLDHAIGAALHGEDLAHLQDHVLRRRPAVELPGEAHADEARVEHLPGEARHHVDGVRAAHAAREHAEPAGVGRVRVGADHHAAREGVLLEHDLMDDARAGSPEADAVARRGAAQELEHLAVRDVRGLHVRRGALIGLDQVIAVHGGRDRGLLAARRDELQDRHLRGRVLHRHAVRAELEVARTGLQLLGLRVGQVAEQDFLCVGQRAPEALARDLEVALDGLVGLAHQRRSRLDRGHRSLLPERGET